MIRCTSEQQKLSAVTEAVTDGKKTLSGKLYLNSLPGGTMDGVFVSNYIFGPYFVKKVRSATSIPLDLHLMIEEPERKLSWFDFGPGDYVSIHYEACRHLQAALSVIRARGAKAMVALNPATPIWVLEEVLCDLDGVLVMTVNPGFAGQKMVPQSPENSQSAQVSGRARVRERRD